MWEHVRSMGDNLRVADVPMWVEMINDAQDAFPTVTAAIGEATRGRSNLQLIFIFLRELARAELGYI